MSLEEFTKHDSGKLRYDLVPPGVIAALADILTFGAEKYGANNWRKNTELDRYVAATMRHFEAYRMGELNDPESDRPHLWHAMTNLAFLIELDEQQRWSPERVQIGPK